MEHRRPNQYINFHLQKTFKNEVTCFYELCLILMGWDYKEDVNYINIIHSNAGKIRFANIAILMSADVTAFESLRGSLVLSST